MERGSADRSLAAAAGSAAPEGSASEGSGRSDRDEGTPGDRRGGVFLASTSLRGATVAGREARPVFTGGEVSDGGGDEDANLADINGGCLRVGLGGGRRAGGVGGSVVTGSVVGALDGSDAGVLEDSDAVGVASGTVDGGSDAA